MRQMEEQGTYLSTLPISTGDSRFRGFFPITRSQQKISRYHDLAQDCFNLKINQFCSRIFFMEGKKIAGERIFSYLAASMKSLLYIPHSSASSERTFSMVRKIVPKNRTSLHNDRVCALLNCKLNCDHTAAGFKPSKVGLNAAKNPHTNIIKPTRVKVRPASRSKCLR